MEAHQDFFPPYFPDSFFFMSFFFMGIQIARDNSLRYLAEKKGLLPGLCQKPLQK